MTYLKTQSDESFSKAELNKNIGWKAPASTVIDMMVKSLIIFLWWYILGADPGTSFYVHNDIFRYQDDIFDESSLENGGELQSQVEINGKPVVDQFAQPVASNGDHSTPQIPMVQEQDIPVQQMVQPEVVQVQPEPVYEPEPVVVSQPVQEPEPTHIEPTTPFEEIPIESINTPNENNLNEYSKPGDYYISIRDEPNHTQLLGY